MSLPPVATQANCVWCQRLAGNGCQPEVCNHLGGGSMALAAQRAKERWVAEAEAERKAGGK